MSGSLFTAFSRSVQLAISRIGPSSRIAVAVSGGPDSVALLQLLARVTREQHARLKQLVAVTVDHQLRPGSTAEAEAVKRFATSLGVEHHILTVRWGQRGFPAFPDAHRTEGPAREARLLLYRELFHREALGSLWTGHHRRDQVENLLMRGRGMQSVAKMVIGDMHEEGQEDVWVVRPLLEFDKLLQYCDENQLPYFLDPTNLDPHHTPRNALRQSLALAQSRHLAHPHTLPSATESNSGPLQLLHNNLSRSLPALSAFSLSNLVVLNEPFPSLLTLRPALLPSRTPPYEARALLRRLIAFASPLPNGGSIPESALEAARRRIWEACSSEAQQSFTPGGGVLFYPAANATSREWIVGRQPRRASERGEHTELLDGVSRLWDGRLWLKLSVYGGGGQGWRYSVQGRGRWSMPVVVRRKEGNAEQVILDLGERRKGQPLSAAGAVDLDDARLSWTCKSKLR